MSHIIECPACSTRYKLNKAIPEGGRPVKCARCGHQWQLVPDVEDEELLELAEPHEAQNSAYDPGNVQAQEDFSQHEADLSRQSWNSVWEDDVPGRNPVSDMDTDTEPRETDLPSTQDVYSSAISSLRDPQSANYDAPAEEAPDFEQSRDRDMRWDDEPEASTEIRFSSPPQDNDDSYAKGLSFLESEQSQPEPRGRDEIAAGSDEKRGSGWAARLLRPWRSKAETVGAEAASADDSKPKDTESEIRDALKYALEHPTEDPDAAKDFLHEAGAENFSQLESELRASAFTDLREKATDRVADFADRFDRNQEPGFQNQTDASGYAFTDFRSDPQSPQDEEEENADPPFRLSGKNAKIPLWGSTGSFDDDGESIDERSGRYEESQYRNEADDVLGSYSQDGAPESAALPADEPFRDSVDDFTKLYDQQFDKDSDDAGPQANLQDDFADLQPEPSENTEIAPYDRKHGRGTLAVAAAWAVFLSVISGIIFTFVAFRQDVMIALPGTTQLYKTLGFAVEEAGVDFADVRYRWTTADGKPMIEVTGQVVNVTDQAVKIPRVLVNVRDAGGSDSVSAAAEVPEDELGPRAATSFTLEFVSPPENVAQIELEFDRNQ